MYNTNCVSDSAKAHVTMSLNPSFSYSCYTM